MSIPKVNTANYVRIITPLLKTLNFPSHHNIIKLATALSLRVALKEYFFELEELSLYSLQLSHIYSYIMHTKLTLQLFTRNKAA